MSKQAYSWVMGGSAQEHRAPRESAPAICHGDRYPTRLGLWKGSLVTEVPSAELFIMFLLT